MRKVIVSMNVTLNGCMAGPDGELDWHYSRWSEDMARTTSAHLGEADTILFGRITYQAMAGYWIAKGRDMFDAREDADFTEMINGYTKIVFSRTLKTTAWQNSRMAKNIAKEVMALKRQSGKDILVYGSGKIVTTLNELNLIDEYRLWVHPVVIHGGRPLFKTNTPLQFTSKTTFDTGVVLMSYKAGLQI
ncbi:dihydrofolate reductase family protein [Mucilaginibacter sp.]|uniref:dihydrofolate reductase family protein n=1 Tax=Mucilaginibacter sp. TaxID=1882438 RepID=UPI0032654954